MTIVIVKMSIPKVKIAVLKNLLIFGEKYRPQSVRLLEGGGVETQFGRIPFEHALSLCGPSLSQCGQCALCDLKSYSVSESVSHHHQYRVAKNAKIQTHLQTRIYADICKDISHNPQAKIGVCCSRDFI